MNVELIKLAFEFLAQLAEEENKWFKTKEGFGASTHNPGVGVVIPDGLVPGVVTAFGLLSEVVGTETPASQMTFRYGGAIYIMQEIGALLSVKTEKRFLPGLL